MEALTWTAIQRGLSTRRFGRPVIGHESVRTTNDRADALAQQGASEETTVIARTKTTGRGRRGRAWLSPAGGLWLSVVLRPKVALEQWPLVGLAASAGAADAVREVALLQARVKWPNDLLVEDRKVGGVLIETSGTGPSAGMRIKANVPPGALDAQTGGISLLGRLGHSLDLAALAWAWPGPFG